ncbi:MAG: FkbM family methyltransferase [Flavobacterium sp.]|nr:FkbM family methyltransferase [Flavobacterium sp.]
MQVNTARKIVPTFVVDFAKQIAYALYRGSEKLFVGAFDKYDFQTFEVFKRVLKPTSNCIDVGAHKGFILEKILKYAPQGKVMAFEPIPDLYNNLKAKFGKKAQVLNIALSNKMGAAEFAYYVDRPAISGFKQRDAFEQDGNVKHLKVPLNTIDNLVPEFTKIDLIKIDVEGAELLVLKGAERTIRNSKPYILFEFGLGGADYYETTPQQIFDYLTDCGLGLSTLEYFLKNMQPFSREEFVGQYAKSYNYFFIAYDAAKV